MTGLDARSERAPEALVVGGGVAGLTCAVALARRGVRVHLLEARAELGGRARSWTDRGMGDRVDVGPHVLLRDYPSFLGLLDVLGTTDRVVWQQRPGLTLAYGSKEVDLRLGPLPPPLHLLPGARHHPYSSLGGLAASLPALLAAMVADEDDVQALDVLDGDTWLRRLGAPAESRREVWSFAARTVLNTSLDRCSAGALARLGTYMFGRRAPHFGFPADGLGDLFVPAARREVERHGGIVETDVRVESLVGHGRCVRGVRLRGGRELRAPNVVVTVPAHELPGLLPESWSGFDPAWTRLTALEPIPYRSAYVWLDRRVTDLQMWARPPSMEGLGSDFYDLANIRPGLEERPSCLAINVIDSERVEDVSNDALVDGLLREVAEFLPEVGRARVLHHRVHHVPMAVHRAAPGTERLRLGPRGPVEGLVLAGDWTRTGLPASMESAARSGWVAAEEVLVALGWPRPRLVRPIGPAQGLARILRATLGRLPRRNGRPGWPVRAARMGEVTSRGPSAAHPR